MNCTKNTQRNNSAVERATHTCYASDEHKCLSSDAVGTLTNYKKVVDIDANEAFKEGIKLFIMDYHPLT